MRKGILEYVVLLMMKEGKEYPSGIIQKLKETNFIVVEGTIYTLLNRLKKEEKLTYEWSESSEGPPRKYFSITSKGIEALSLLENEWQSLLDTVNNIKGK
ncbi:MAG: PadR family transcriptional regulator [Prevotella sp.]|nr:PadR family transcriptional regulator [Bacteroides sp.]MCM1366749.1 PadR family transcriptional regulator [Prevotella sp.]MCM1437013.1 PadR family transcriptional regulator [Prevotella sp.]